MCCGVTQHLILLGADGPTSTTVTPWQLHSTYTPLSGTSPRIILARRASLGSLAQGVSSSTIYNSTKSSLKPLQRFHLLKRLFLSLESIVTLVAVVVHYMKWSTYIWGVLQVFYLLYTSAQHWKCTRAFIFLLLNGIIFRDLILRSMGRKYSCWRHEDSKWATVAIVKELPWIPFLIALGTL